MPTSTISQHIITLLTYVSLNDSNWFTKLLKQLIKNIIWKNSNSITLEEIYKIFIEKLHLDIELDEISLHIAQLLSSGEVKYIDSRFYTLLDKEAQQIEYLFNKANKEEEATRVFFIELCKTECPNLNADLIFNKFYSALIQTIKVMGANMFIVLNYDKIRKNEDWLKYFISDFDQDVQPCIKNIINKFFDAIPDFAKNFILRLLKIYFFIGASHLNIETLKFIEQGKRKKINLILDTNIIFSILELHDNPGDKYINNLIKIIKENRIKCDIKLFVLRQTIDEATKVLINTKESLKNIQFSPAMVNALLTRNPSGIIKKFLLNKAKDPNLMLNMFDLYIDGLEEVLKEYGITVYTISGIFHKNTFVTDDINDVWEQNEYLQKKKSYESLLHDVVFWHVVDKHRTNNLNNPFDIVLWGITIDWWLIGFDQKKRKQSTSVPCVLYPSHLIQFLQFWIPPTHDLDDSLIECLKLNLFFRPMDEEDEKATLQIASLLSQYKQLPQLSENVISKILSNRILRDKIKKGDLEIPEADKIFNEELILNYNENLNELENAKAAIQNDARQITDLSNQNINLKNDIEKLKQKNSESEESIKQLSRQIKNEIMIKQKTLYISILLFIPTIIYVFGNSYISNHVILPLCGTKAYVYADVISGCLIFISFLLLSHWYSNTHDYIKDWWLTKTLPQIIGQLITGVLAFILKSKII